eukprot:m.598383 g.598383  ORF g.598383 m.598383 type:complete len:63 (-) comp22421_c0_seq9:23-211(-)
MTAAALCPKNTQTHLLLENAFLSVAPRFDTMTNMWEILYRAATNSMYCTLAKKVEVSRGIFG